MRGPARELDHDYTVVGRAVVGLDVIRSMAVGEPPADPDRMLSVRVAADLPPADQPRLEVMNTGSRVFAGRSAAVKRAKGAAFTICDVQVPVRPAGR